mmetsp:Transcript_11832/g.38971  ORF Transcript_11832/g.38971 Transcript_11832/m.38971 type:complete len:329 (-) Transcript_11832:227-1213(-)|eukprot:CAMPEP_0118919618 /NCGR_PEP_ID=MMETSP1166-20130328/18651_1 /TAXON_ID=1104430 /ORGANISM="Chrysoreinhardia sp, Strain CCMP3193" /LENGTH=328 /DNA_ID=CAMNT_0006860149 /DNA_START=34 /DNA_END=1020 /DNA_ORIENTATION=+
MVPQPTLPFRELVALASSAPSSHNSQPWLFKESSGGGVEVRPDLTRALPVCDPKQRELWVSVGCAVGVLNGTWKLEGDVVRVTPGVPRVEVVKKRRSVRGAHGGGTADVPPGSGCVAKGGDEWKAIVEAVKEADAIQWSDDAYRDELVDWIRFNRKEVDERRDGLSYACTGSPPMPRFIGRPLLKWLFLTPATQLKADLEAIATSSHFKVFALADDDAGPAAWIQLGVELMDFLLDCTERNVAVSFLNQCCQVDSVNATLKASLLGDDENKRKTPVVVLRLGTMTPDLIAKPRAPRRPLDDIILLSDHRAYDDEDDLKPSPVVDCAIE